MAARWGERRRPIAHRLSSSPPPPSRTCTCPRTLTRIVRCCGDARAAARAPLHGFCLGAVISVTHLIALPHAARARAPHTVGARSATLSPTGFRCTLGSPPPSIDQPYIRGMHYRMVVAPYHISRMWRIAARRRRPCHVPTVLTYYVPRSR